MEHVRFWPASSSLPILRWFYLSNVSRVEKIINQRLKNKYEYVIRRNTYARRIVSAPDCVKRTHSDFQLDSYLPNIYIIFSFN